MQAILPGPGQYGETARPCVFRQPNGKHVPKHGGSGYDKRLIRPIDPSTMKSSFVAPLILIVLGLFFLASNLGWTDASLGHLLAKWWPLILVAAGVTMLVDRSKK